MTDTPPEWAMAKAAQICQQTHRMDTDSCIIIARALTDVEAETAERVERETIERCAEIANEPRLWPSSFTLHQVGKTIATAIRYLPAKYGKAKT